VNKVVRKSLCTLELEMNFFNCLINLLHIKADAQHGGEFLVTNLTPLFSLKHYKLLGLDKRIVS